MNKSVDMAFDKLSVTCDMLKTESDRGQALRQTDCRVERLGGCETETHGRANVNANGSSSALTFFGANRPRRLLFFF